MTICVCGKDPFDGFLDEAVRGKLAHNLPVRVRRLPEGDESSTGCQILFVSPNKTSRAEDILGRLNGSSVLTIGDMDGFAERG